MSGPPFGTFWVTYQRMLMRCIRKRNTTVGSIRGLPVISFKKLFSPVGLIVNYSDHIAPSMHFSRQYCTAPSHRKLPVLTLYTKQPCPLCDQALNELKPLLAQVNLEKVDITAPENKAWWKAYRYDIPVFHLNGKFLMKHKADVDKLQIALKDFHKDNNPS